VIKPNSVLSCLMSRSFNGQLSLCWLYIRGINVLKAKKALLKENCLFAVIPTVIKTRRRLVPHCFPLDNFCVGLASQGL